MQTLFTLVFVEVEPVETVTLTCLLHFLLLLRINRSIEIFNCELTHDIYSKL